MASFETTRRALLALIGGLPIFHPARASKPGTVTLMPRLAEGQSLRYRKETEQWRNGALSLRSRSEVTLEVLQRLDGGWLARWTENDEGGSLEADARMLPMLQSMQDLWDGLPVDLVLDEAGRVAGLADPARVQALAGASLDRLVGAMPAEPDNGLSAEGLRAMLAPILGDGTYLGQSLLKHPAILMGAMGLTYRVGEPLEVAGMAASPVGEGEIPLLSRYSLRGIDAVGGRADLGWLMVMDRRRAVSAIAPAIHKLLDTAGAASNEAIKPSLDAALAQLDLDDRGDFIVDTTTAWPLRVRHERRTVNGPASRVDRLALTRLDG